MVIFLQGLFWNKSTGDRALSAAIDSAVFSLIIGVHTLLGGSFPIDEYKSRALKVALLFFCAHDY